jgi:hypothetical protein
MEISHIKQEINITESLMARINELFSHYPEDKKNRLYCLFCTKFKMLTTIG